MVLGVVVGLGVKAFNIIGVQASWASRRLGKVGPIKPRHEQENLKQGIWILMFPTACRYLLQFLLLFHHAVLPSRQDHIGQLALDIATRVFLMTSRGWVGQQTCLGSYLDLDLKDSGFQCSSIVTLCLPLLRNRDQKIGYPKIQKRMLQSGIWRVHAWERGSRTSRFLVHAWDRIIHVHVYSLWGLSTHKHVKCYPTMTKVWARL